MATLETNSTFKNGSAEKQKLSQAYDLVEEGAQEQQNKMKQAYKLAGEAATDFIQDVKGQAQSKFDENKVKADELTAKAGSAIADKPLLSIGVAFVAGLAISRLLK